MSIQQQPKKLVYGEVSDGWIFIREEEALRLAQIHWALQGASTWGEFRRMAPNGVYEEIIEMFREGDAEDFDEFLRDLREDEPGITVGEAKRKYWDSEIGAERFPGTAAIQQQDAERLVVRRPQRGAHRPAQR